MCGHVGPKGPGLVKKYPAVAGYFIKESCLSRKLDLKKAVFVFKFG